jgi:hypothetical protein
VTEVNAAPVLANVPATASIVELVPYTFTATATDADFPAQTLTFSLVGAPAGASIGSGTGVFTWTPTDAQGPASYPFTVEVSDGVTSTSAAITLTVLESNSAPVLASVPASATIAELSSYTFTASATDTDIPAQTLTFSLVGAPAGATIGSASGEFAWTPTEAQGPGTYPFTVRVSDGVTNTDASISLTVTEVNAAPALAGVPSTAAIPELAPYTFTATATDSDVPAQTLSFSLIGAPSGAAIDPSTGVFTWTPTEAQGPGSHPFTVRVSDGIANADASITLDVTEVNVAPVLSGVPGSATIPELSAYTFTAMASDEDARQTLTFSLVNAPTGANIDPETGEFAWTPTEAQGPGSYPFTVRVSDGVVDTDAEVTLTVEEVNVAPVIAGVPSSATIVELAPYTFTATAADADEPAQPLTFSLVSAPGGASIDPSTGVFTWTPTEAQGPGSYPFTVRVSDGVAVADASISLTVNELNGAPALSGVPASAVIPELAPHSFTASASDSDTPAQTLTFSLVGAPGGASIDPVTGVFAWTPSETQGPGSHPFLVRVSDGVTDTDAAITLDVTEVNVAPALSGVPASATLDEGAPYTFTASATDPDLPAQSLTFSLVGAPSGATIDPVTGVFTWTPSEADGPGTYPFTVRVGDGLANADAAITLTVTEGNTAPTLAGVPASATIPENAPYTFNALTSDPDVPAQAATFTLDAGAPAGASIDPATGVFAWTPGETQGPGDYSVTVRVTDDGTPPLFATATISIHVDEVNVAPVVSGVPSAVTIPELVPYAFTAAATDADVPVQGVTFSLVGAPAGASIDGGTGAFTWTPTEAQGPGVHGFAVRASDGVANTDFPITITVDEVTIAAAANLTATRLDTGNDADGTARIQLSWTPTGPGTTVEIYRAGFGGYPRYDDVGGAEPVVPSYPPGAPWTLVPVATPGGTDEPATRDFYYYVAFVRGAGLNVSAASARTSGTLNYHLGDVTDGATTGQGDNLVNSADISLLGAHYGVSGAALASFEYLDVGPTTDLSRNGRPLTDQALDFEDLVLYAVNFELVSSPAIRTGPEAEAAAADVVALLAPAHATPGQPLVATLHLSGTGRIQAASLALGWDPEVVRPVRVEAGAMVTGAGGVLMSPGAGAADVALLGAREVGLVGEGVLATFTFEVLAAGDPKLVLQRSLARDVHNQPVPVTGTVSVALWIPERTALSLPAPNPFRGAAWVELAMARPGAARVEVFSVDGRRVRTLADRAFEPGIHRLVWDGRDDHGRGLGTGVYFLRAAADRQVFMRRVTLLK